MAAVGLILIFGTFIAAAWFAQARWGGWQTVPVALVGFVVLVAYISTMDYDPPAWLVGLLFLAALVLKHSKRRRSGPRRAAGRARA